MAEYYMDVETTGLDPRKDKIISVQYQRLGAITGRIEESLIILKEWEMGEDEVLKKFLPRFLGINDFDFVPIGFNIPFIFSFLRERAFIVLNKKISANRLFGRKPYLDLKPLIVIFNKGSFKGATLDRMTPLLYSGDKIPDLYKNGSYDEIIKGVIDEAEKFVKLYQYVKATLPLLLKEHPFHI